jgi:hypothetical protein
VLILNDLPGLDCTKIVQKGLTFVNVEDRGLSKKQGAKSKNASRDAGARENGRTFNQSAV